jgi:hypothetical protein
MTTTQPHGELTFHIVKKAIGREASSLLFKDHAGEDGENPVRSLRPDFFIDRYAPTPAAKFVGTGNVRFDRTIEAFFTPLAYHTDEALSPLRALVVKAHGGEGMTSVAEFGTLVVGLAKQLKLHWSAIYIVGDMILMYFQFIALPPSVMTVADMPAFVLLFRVTTAAAIPPPPPVCIIPCSLEEATHSKANAIHLWTPTWQPCYLDALGWVEPDGLLRPPYTHHYHFSTETSEK